MQDNQIKHFTDKGLAEVETGTLHKLYKELDDTPKEKKLKQQIVDEILNRESITHVQDTLEAKKIDREEQGFLIGDPIPWSKFTEAENIKEWIWENYIAKGNITLLSALWKAGKSTFLRNLFVAINEEREFAGQPTTKSRILVVSEEDSGEWYSQKADLEDEQIEHVLVWSRPIRMKPNLKQWIELIEALTARCIEEKVDVIVIDTITTFWPIDNENDSAQVIKALVPLYSFTENHIAVVLVHHFRKGGGDQAQASRGSGALPGFVDNIIEFTRKDDGLATQRVLKTYGRFDSVIPQVVIDLTDDGYITLGEPWQVSKLARIHKIIEIFEQSITPLSVKDVHNFWITSGTTIDVKSVRNYINQLEKNKLLSAVEEKIVVKRKTPYYSLSEGYEELRQTLYPLPLRPFRSSVITEVRQGINGRGEPLSAVNVIGQEDLPEWKDPDPRV